MNPSNNGHTNNGAAVATPPPPFSRRASGPCGPHPAESPGPQPPTPTTPPASEMPPVTMAPREPVVAEPLHDARGRFIKGKRGGPGNPFARQLAAFRQVFIDSATLEDMRDIARAVILRAKAGDMAAARIACNYLMGKPAPGPDIDRLNATEWKMMKEQTDVVRDFMTAPDVPSADVPLILARLRRDQDNVRAASIGLGVAYAKATPDKQREWYPDGKLPQEWYDLGLVPPVETGLTGKARRKLRKAARRAEKRAS